jgi:hypothetical protein
LESLLDRITEYASAVVDSAGGAEPLARWEEGTNLLIEAALHETPVDPDRFEELRVAVDAARATAVQRGDRPGLVEWVKGRVSELQDALADAEVETEGPAVAFEILDEGRWLRLLLARAGRGRADVALEEAGREAAEFCRVLGGETETGDETVSIRIRLLSHRLDAVEASAEGATDDGDLMLALTAAEALADESARLAAFAPSREDAGRLSARGDKLERDLRHGIEQEIRSAAPEQAAALAGSLAAFSAEAADEARVSTAELTPDEAKRTLARARRGLERVLAVWRSLDGRPRKPKAVRRLSRIRRRLRAEEQEQGLQARLEGIFGRRTVTFSENLILVLILGVVGLLIYEGIADPSDEVRHTLVWVDAGICAVFLLEIGVRLALVPGGRGRWFLRHLPFDVLPSIPFGLLVHAMETLDVARAGRVARLFRLNRLARYVRIVRPFIRLFRVLAFLLRGLDRLVHRNSRALNRDVLLFTPPPAAETIRCGAEASIPAELEHDALDAVLHRLEGAEDEEREAGLRTGLARTGCFVERGTAALDKDALEAPIPHSRSPEIRIEELIDGLARANPASVERRLGVHLTTRLADKLRWLDLPILRQLPLVRRFASGTRRRGDADVVARAARSAGRTVRRLYDRVLAVGDLSGMISGPQVLDRVGGALARSAGRPARRLLFIGALFLIVHGLVNLLDVGGLEDAMNWLQKFLGTPILVLGGVCLVLFSTGVWFRRIAGEATDFLERTAEAQYMNLLKIAKCRRLDEDLTLIQARVLEPDRLLAGGARADPEKIAAGASRLHEEVEQALGGRRITARVGGHGGEDLSRRFRVLGLVHDYLDGATLHHSDRKITEQLLGNLGLMNLWSRRLTLTRDHRLRLKRLDLSREGGFRGPYLWFNFITRTVAQRTAELILEYNRHARSITGMTACSPEEQRANEEWIERRIAGRTAQVFTEECPFRTTFFTALHFLTTDAELEAAVEERFGARTLVALRADRRRMIREIFGTYPLHLLPRVKRVLNPFELYRRHVAGFRVVFLPLKLLWLYLRGMGAFIRRLGQIVREVRWPELASQARARGIAGFDVAMRKVGRMRGPVFRECAWLRALVDVEYLGLGVPGLPGRTVPTDFEDDLAELPMVGDWRERLLELREERRGDLRSLRKLLSEQGVSAENLEPLMGRPAEDAAAGARILRALCVAYSADDRQCRSLLTASERIEDAFDEVQADPLAAPRRGLVRRALDLLLFPFDRLPRMMTIYLAAHPRQLTPGQRRQLLQTVRSDHHGIRPLMKLAGDLEYAGRTRLAAWDRLQEIVADRERLDEELLTLRTVQTLSVIDARHYRDLIRRLGGYDQPDED